MADETPDQRVARIVAEVQSGQRTLTSVRQSVDRLAGRPVGDYSNVSDEAWLGSPERLAERVRSIFGNRGVPLTLTQGNRQNAYLPDVTPPAQPGPQDPSGQLDEDLKRTDAYVSTLGLMRQFGLESLAPKILDFLREGYTDAPTITLLLQETPEYKTRFKANEARVKAGLPVLSPAEYIGLERQYQQVMRAYGLPPSFYDQREDFERFIGNDVSPAEVNERVQMASKLVQDANPEIREALASYYPDLTQGDLIANLLDEKRAMPLLQKKIAAAEIGAAAVQRGLARTDAEAAARWADQGVTGEQARQGYEAIGSFLPGTQSLGDRFGEQYTQADAEQEVFGGLASARRKRERLAQQERGLFAGDSAVGRDSLSRRSNY